MTYANLETVTAISIIVFKNGVHLQSSLKK